MIKPQSFEHFQVSYLSHPVLVTINLSELTDCILYICLIAWFVTNTGCGSKIRNILV